MDHGYEAGDVKFGFCFGAVCGFFKFLDIYLLADPYMIVLLKVLLTGMVGGFGGVAGKYFFSYLKKKYEDYKNKKP